MGRRPDRRTKPLQQSSAKTYLVGAKARVICRREKEGEGIIGERNVSRRRQKDLGEGKRSHPGPASVASYDTQPTWWGLWRERERKGGEEEGA